MKREYWFAVAVLMIPVLGFFFGSSHTSFDNDNKALGIFYMFCGLISAGFGFYSFHKGMISKSININL